MATSRLSIGTKMKNCGVFFASSFIILVSFCSGCETAEREIVTGPSHPATSPEPHSSPTAPTPPIPEWMAAGATYRVADIISAPNAFFGKAVTVVGEVEEVFGPRAFALGGEDSSGDKGHVKTLLILVPKVGDFPNVDARWKSGEARIIGVVQRMAPKDVEREIGWITPLSLESRFRGKPVLIARWVERLVE